LKIYRKVVISGDGEIVEEVSYEYNGPIDQCLGGSSGGGGGGSGAVSYPSYMQNWHGAALGQGAFNPTMTTVMNSALGNSPWTGQAAYNPNTDTSMMITSVEDLQDLVNLLSSSTPLNSLVANVLSESRIDDAVDEFSADALARIDSEIIPRFERGMQDINAVVSSAFVIGRALIMENSNRQISKYSADLHMRAFSEDALKIIQMKLDYQRMASTLTSEVYRIKMVAKKEENDLNIKIDEEDAKWDLEVFQYGSNLLASIGGGTVNPQKQSISTAQSVIGGALSGAAAGAMVGAEIGAVGGPLGGLIGAILGGASGLL